MHFPTIAILTGVLALYLVAGGLVFQHLERLSAEQLVRRSNFSVRLEENSSLSNVTEADVELIKKLFFQVVETVESQSDYEIARLVNLTAAIESSENGTNNLTLRITDALYDDWNLYSAIFYAETVVATVGFGYIHTETQGGKVVAAFYAMIGVPLIGVWLKLVGESMLAEVTRLRRKVNVDQQRWRRQLLYAQALAVILLGSVIFILCPAAVFSYMEQWSYLASFYFALMTLTTIGLGDLVAGVYDDAPAWYRIFINLWLLFGLCWLSTIISLSVEIFKHRATKAVEKVASAFADRIRSRRRTITGTRRISVISSQVHSDSVISAPVEKKLQRKRLNRSKSYFDPPTEQQYPAALRRQSSNNNQPVTALLPSHFSANSSPLPGSKESLAVYGLALIAGGSVESLSIVDSHGIVNTLSTNEPVIMLRPRSDSC